MIINPPLYHDPLVDMLFAHIEAESAKEEPRRYVGASSIGDKCERKLWYQYNMPETAKPAPAKLILAAQDGHRSEDVAASWLRQVPGVELWTHKSNGKQYGFSDMGGRFRGHVDGIIKGIPLAPVTPHIWEHKAKNQKSYDALLKLKDQYDIKEVLQKWDYTYYCQAVINMHYFDIKRHYMTVSLPGFRDLQTIRTDANPTIAEGLIAKAARILTYDRPPAGISQNPAWWECKFCKFNKQCFKEKLCPTS